MVDIIYSKAFSEVLEILKYISKMDYEKIPLEIIEIMEDNCRKDYVVEYNPHISLVEQDISEEARTIIAIFFRDYWATEEQREKIILKERIDLEKFEDKKRETYNPEDIFKNRQDKIVVENKNLPVEINKESLFKKIINLIKSFIKI